MHLEPPKIQTVDKRDVVLTKHLFYGIIETEKAGVVLCTEKRIKANKPSYKCCV